MARDKLIARSIAAAIAGKGKKEPKSYLAHLLAIFSAIFSFFDLPLRKISPDDFARLRREDWHLKDDDYIASFQDGEGTQGDALHSIGDMGFSGSTFYATEDQRFLVKSVPRHSEHSFFHDDLLKPYVAHMVAHPTSLLVRICDFLGAAPYSLGKILQLAPSHHIVMDNIMYGQEQAAREGKPEWKHWDLKPTSYFYPERDIASGMLATEATLSRLADEFDGEMALSRDDAAALFKALEADTRLLAQHNAVDYSLFIVRIAAADNPDDNADGVANPFVAPNSADVVPLEPPAVPPELPSWRTGVPSRDGRYLFRAAVLDFFWAKHKIQPRLMTALISAWNALTGQGHMSITTTPEEYRERFLSMCRGMITVKDAGSISTGGEEQGERSEDA